MENNNGVYIAESILPFPLPRLPVKVKKGRISDFLSGDNDAGLRSEDLAELFLFCGIKFTHLEKVAYIN